MYKLISKNPATGKSNGSVTVSSLTEIKKKVEAANNAKESWRRIGIAQRIEYVRRAYGLFKRRADEIATIITKEVGTPITECRGEVEWDWSYLDWFLDNLEKALTGEAVGEDASCIYKTTYEPLGTAAVITPWNLPFDLFLWGVIPNLLVGNTVIHKASEECALSGKLFADIMEEVQFPEGVFSAVHGDGKQGAFLVDQDIDLIWFTGSSSVGKKLFATAGKKFIRSVLEMGGSNPAILFEDCNIEAAIPVVKFKRFAYCGQTCDAVKRLIVHKSILARVVEQLRLVVDKIVLGDPVDPKVEIGPLVSIAQRDLLAAQVDDAVKKGARVVIGGEKPNRPGAYYLPTILTHVTPSMRVWKEEVFGPVLSVVPFETEEEAVTLANDTRYGLSAQVYTQDTARVMRVFSELKAGSVDINGASHFKPFCPFGGVKESGMGREHGIDGIRELCQMKVLSMKK